VIGAARSIGVIVTGGDKAAMVARAIEGPMAPAEVPAQLARRGAWFLDRAAAAMLSAREVGA
jgi:6-phosphogluconolactonase/glucosamine-6-phosphate isomerase/deaminase